MSLQHITYYVQNSLFQENYDFVQIYRKTPTIPSTNSKELALNFSLFECYLYYIKTVFFSSEYPG